MRHPKISCRLYAIQSFPGLIDEHAASCSAQSMMLEDGYGTSTLGDFNTALTVLLLTKLRKERFYNSDLQHINKKSDEIKNIGDGACPPSLAGSLGPAGFAEHGIPTEGDWGRTIRQVDLQGRRRRARQARKSERRIPTGCYTLHGLRTSA